MISVKFKGISVIRYAFIFRFIKQLGYRYSPLAATTLTWGNKSNLNGDSVVCIEDGFIRSVGLGVHFNQPLSLVFDAKGIYFDATKPSELEDILNTASFDKVILNRAYSIRNRLIELGISKYNVGQEFDFVLPINKKLILVPGQVEGDASIKYGSPTIKTNFVLLEKVRLKNPHAYIIYKPHPDVLAGERDNGVLGGDITLYADLVITDVSIDKVLNVVDEVHTMTSLTGFEALLRGKHVCTYGLPFYAGWGLTNDVESCIRRKRTLTLDQLVAGVLILYPAYIDPSTQKLCTVERVIEIIAMQRQRVDVAPTLYQSLLFSLRRAKTFSRRIFKRL